MANVVKKGCLFKAVKAGDRDECSRILESGGVDVNERDNARYPYPTSIMIASEIGRVDIVALLLSKGANVNDKDDSGFSPLHMASKEGRAEVVEMLISNGARVNNKDSCGRSPLSIASYFGHADIVEMLISEDALISKLGNLSSSLYIASTKGYAKVVEVLISKGALVNDKDGYERSPLYWASWKGHAGVVEMLISNGAIVNDKDDYGRSPLYIASWNGHVEVVALLISKGANLCAISQGRTCFDKAMDHDKITFILRNWHITMMIVVFHELGLYYFVETESLIDLFQFLGILDDAGEAYILDNSEDYNFDNNDDGVDVEADDN